MNSCEVSYFIIIQVSQWELFLMVFVSTKYELFTVKENEA